ncbi:putative dithiol-disulfide isomerase involved in polyketide biosynthesis [Belliella baltica DSM 15883]|uniref:Putative dithiol-disulfide isomerase involved in polyketide biosynthesis n=1 Tax=Belliella baltica (strain DSM 15883 / CIP 108006 / LMG 21964 / BA134) TaxID=866536 RepID=I3Z907_BELBD|nr:DsbA family protein [Belliella baltica]AFL85725.1 putative dithiol-disulfide isomerase involved in polyketide biosynthesis [Belliella baltica DSM 15883]
MIEQNNPLLCDLETGLCEIPDSSTKVIKNEEVHSPDKPIKVIYYTDPICSSCWGIEPQLRKLKLEYGSHLAIEYRMGGLLPDWSYSSGGISKASDVAHHWDEVSLHYDMPIDGDVWLEDPLDSSYPPSIAFKAAEMQNEDLAIAFLREIREMVFLQKKNISKWENLKAAAEKVGLDLLQFRSDFEGTAKRLFEEDLMLGRKLGVRGFPSLYFSDDQGNTEFVYGTKAYAFYEIAVLKLAPEAKKSDYKKNWEALFAKYPSLTAREFSELSSYGRVEAEEVLDALTTQEKLVKETTKNGSLWKINKVVE